MPLPNAESGIFIMILKNPRPSSEGVPFVASFRFSMKMYWKKNVFFAAAAVLIALFLLYTRYADLLSFESFKNNSSQLVGHVHEHYTVSIVVFGALFISTAFFLPGALVLTLAGGFLFGAWAGAFYACVFSTAGASFAFLLSRYLLGGWVQARYAAHLERFNREVTLHGANYLFFLRVVPVMPFFLVNYLAGVTKISTARYTLVTFLGISPGSLVYSLAGRQFQNIKDPEDILSAKMITLFILIALFSLLPVCLRRMKRSMHRS